MTELSPAVQAVVNAAYALPLKNGQPNIAAAFRAAAEQVPDLPKNCSSYDINVQDGREEVRSFLLTIVAELETQ